MTKRQKKTRVRKISTELVARMRERFPAVELVAIEDWPNVGAVLRIYAPYEDKVEVMESVVDRIVDAIVDEGITISILPVSQKPAVRPRASGKIPTAA